MFNSVYKSKCSLSLQLQPVAYSCSTLLRPTIGMYFLRLRPTWSVFLYNYINARFDFSTTIYDQQQGSVLFNYDQQHDCLRYNHSWNADGMCLYRGTHPSMKQCSTGDFGSSSTTNSWSIRCLYGLFGWLDLYKKCTLLFIAQTSGCFLSKIEICH